MKKVISIALALLMVAVMLPVMAMAEDVNDATTLKTAVAAGGEVTLGADITASITVENGKTVTLNLNGKTLTNEAGSDTIYVKMGGTLIINGTGTVDNVSHGRAAIFNNGTVTLNGGTYTRSAEAGTGKDGENSANGNSWYTICNHGIMTVYAGVTVENKGTFSSLFENGYQSYTGSTGERSNYVDGTNQAAPSLTINGGTFKGGKITIKNDDGGTLVINDGMFTNNGNRTVFNANKATINGGEFNCPTTYFGNGIAVDTAHFDGGNNAGTLEIFGGTFNGRITKNEGSNVGISGGTFNTDVRPYVHNELVVVGGSTYYVGGIAYDAVRNATSGEFNVVNIGDRPDNFTVNPGVTIKNNTNENIIVNGNEVKPNETYPNRPIIIITPTEDTPKADDQKNPSTGANDFVGVAAAMVVVSLLGAAAVIRKK